MESIKNRRTIASIAGRYPADLLNGLLEEAFRTKRNKAPHNKKNETNKFSFLENLSTYKIFQLFNYRDRLIIKNRK